MLMAIQAGLGLVFRSQYRDVDWIRSTWLGNDLVTLLVAAPLLAFGARRAPRASSRWRVVTLGLLAYAFYNNAYYLFGAALNVFFPIYVVLCVFCAWALVVSISEIDWSQLGGAVPAAMSARLLGSLFVVVGIGLAVVWLGMWAAYVLRGIPTPVDVDAFRLVAALDLVLIVPLLVASGVLLWRRRLLGIWIGGATGTQASVYLTVLSVNSATAMRGGASAELPMWAALAVFMAAATVALFRNMGAARAPLD